ncbi:MAG: ABC transporter permease [Vicinamibacterales bacterium]
MRLLRLLLHLYPAPLREDRGRELLALVARDLSSARGLARAGHWVAAAADIVASAIGAHLDLLTADLRDVGRTFRRSPGFAVTVVAVSALGVGATTTAFSLADHVLVRPLPFPDPDRLVKLWQDQSSRGYSRMELSPANFEDWRRQSTAFASVSAYTESAVTAVTASGPMRLSAAQVTVSLFDTLGVGAAHGRTFVAADETSATPPVVVSHGFWRAALGGRDDVLGTTLAMNGTPYTVVGVMPAGFDFPARDLDVWLPLWFTPDLLSDRTNVFLRAVARLAPGVTIERARGELSAIADGLARAYPEANDKTGATVVALRDEVPGQARTLIMALLGASAAVLVIACTNLASLLLARAAARQRELGIRLTMGARPRRLVRQMLTESLALAGLGGACGIAIAAVAVPVAAALVPTQLPIAEAPSLDWRMVAIAVTATVVTGLAFGLAPAWRLSRAGADVGLRHGARVFGTRSTERARATFVVAQLAATVALLVVAGLFLQALWRVRQIDPGFRADGVLTARIELPMPAYAGTKAREAFYARVLDEVRRQPGVTSAAYTSFLPIVMRGGVWPMLTNATTVADDARMASVRFVTPGYFAAMGVRMVSGRDIAPTDGEGTGPVAVVSESFARTHWPGRNPLGEHVGTPYTPQAQVVGVVGDVRVRGLERESEPQIYFAAAQMEDGSVLFFAPKDLVVRTAGPIEGLGAAIRRAVAGVDPLLPVTGVRPLSRVLDLDTESRRVQIDVLLGFSGLALLLVLVGVHSLLAYVVAARTQEIGVRMALGASPARVCGLVLSRTAVLSALGVTLGCAVAFAASRSLGALLAGISPADLSTYGAAALVSAGTALAASALPASRAARVDPLSAMRTE